MSVRCLLTIYDPASRELIQQTDVEVLADYPDALLVHSEERVTEALGAADIETAVISQKPISLSASTFSIDGLAETEERELVTIGPGRRAYHLVELIGPPKGEWLAKVQSYDGLLQQSSLNDILLVGVLPEPVGQFARSREGSTINEEASSVIAGADRPDASLRRCGRNGDLIEFRLQYVSRHFVSG